MMNIKGIFAVSLIAMVAMVAGAHTSNAVAAIASKGYVDQQVGSKANATDLARKVDIYQGDAKANQAVITNGTGNITTGFITKSMLGADVEIPAKITVDSALSSTSTNPVQNKVINTALNAKEVTSNKVTSANYDANVSSDTKYPTVKAVANAIADVEKTIPDAITVDSALSSTSTNPVQNKVVNAALNGKVATAQGPNAVSKAVITNASGNITTGTISSAMITDGTITNADISASAAIAQSKISGLTTALAGKVATAQGSNAVNKAVITDASGNITTGQIASGMIAKDAVTADKIADGVIPTVNNATLTIQKNSATVDTFTANASENKTINITVPTKTSELDNDSGFVTSANLPVATANTLGGVKSGGSITVDTSGTVTVNSAQTATNAKNAVRAENDEEGNNIKSTYAKKSDIPTASDILTATTVTSSGTGAVLTGVSVEDGKVTLQKGNVQIPSGGQNATSYVSIWVE